MTPDVIQVRPLPNYTLEAQFATGEWRRFDIRSYLRHPAFSALLDQLSMIQVAQRKSGYCTRHSISVSNPRSSKYAHHHPENTPSPAGASHNLETSQLLDRGGVVLTAAEVINLMTSDF